jgi:hypothetical protein
MSAPTEPTARPKPLIDPNAQPFGLPTGSVRGILSLLICGFFWVTMLLPPPAGEEVVRPLLAHFFLLGLVLMAFANHPTVTDRNTAPFLPWVLRLAFVGGSIGVVVYAAVTDPARLQQRLTPNPDEVKLWWIPFLACMAGGFAFGLLLRFVLGRGSLVFRSIRAWLSVVGMVMLAVELVLVLGVLQATGDAADFLRYWQCVEVVLVAAYFGTRA